MIHLRLLGPVGLSATDGTEVRAVLTQPKRLALLAYLAAAGPGAFHRRDTLLALFWPESSERQARLALRQALHHLRRALGAAVIANRGDTELGLAPGVLWCDAVEFRRALRSGDPVAALELYRGDLLDGFSIGGISVELERWLDEERVALRTLAASAASSLSERAATGDELPLAVQWARRALTLSGDDESVLRRLVAMLDRGGDRAGALRTAEEFARRMREELGAGPAPETEALVADVRARAQARTAAEPATRPTAESPSTSTAAEPPVKTTAELPAMVTTEPAAERRAEAPAGADHVAGEAPPRRRRRQYRFAASVGVALLAVVVTVAAVRLRAAHHVPPVIAVGWVDNPGGGDEQAMARLLPALLETNLAQVPGQRTLSDARLHELLGQLGSRDATREAVTNAARLGGATELLEGTLYHRTGDTLRLDLRRVDLETGVVRRAYQVQGATPFALADRAAESIARDLELPAPAQGGAERTSASLVAQGFFEEGLRTYYQVGVQQSNPFFLAALREDSTCAMCAYYASITEGGLAALQHFRTAVRLANRAPERDRLYIQAAWSGFTGVAPMLVAAESLVTRYPDDPEAQLRMASALSNAGRFLESVPYLRREIELDSLGLRGSSPLCRACEAEATLVGMYWAVDSFAAAERVARAWIHAQPRSRRAWSALADTYQRLGRYGAARAARDAAVRLGLIGDGAGDARARSDIRSGDFASADAYASLQARNGGPRERADALWWLTISLRNQGRLREALASSERQILVGDTAHPGVSRLPSALAKGQVLFELGRFRDAAELFRSLASTRPPAIEGFPGTWIRQRCWALTHEAESLAALGDTAAITALADTIERLGPRSSYGRDRLLHHHLRGLVAAARGDWPAAESEFRAAIYSVTEGYTRTNLHLARVLLAEHRPREAVVMLQPVLRGGLEGSELYVTRTEIHEALGEAFAMAGQPDSAAAHDQVVVRAWAHADPIFADRVARAHARLVEARALARR